MRWIIQDCENVISERHLYFLFLPSCNLVEGISYVTWSIVIMIDNLAVQSTSHEILDFFLGNKRRLGYSRERTSFGS